MGYDADLLEEHRLIVFHLWGRFVPEEAIETLQNLPFDAGRVASYDSLLVVHEQSDLSLFSPKAVHDFIQADHEVFSDIAPGLKPKFAIVCPDSFKMLVMRFMLGILELYPDYPEERMSFERLEDALRWLGKSDPALSGRVMDSLAKIRSRHA